MPGRGSPQRREPSQIRARQRFLQPEHVVGRQLGGDVARGDRIQRRSRVTGHPPALVEVDHQRHGVADRGARRGHRRHPVGQSSRINPDLHGAKALLAQSQRGLGPGGRGEQRPARGVGRDPVARPTEERRDGQAGDLPDDVPQRRLERPIATGVEIDGLEDADMAGDRERVPPDEQVLVRLEPVHRVTRAHADDTVIGLDAHDRDREGTPGLRVPRGLERRFQGNHESLQPDRRDAHERSIADPSPAAGRGPAAIL